MQPTSRANVWAPSTGTVMYGSANLPLPDSAFADPTLEPQFVRVRAANRAYLYLNSADLSNAGYSTTNCVVGSPGDGVLMQKVKRLGIAGFQFTYSTPVINRSNNTLYIFSSATNTITTVTIPIGNWNTPQLLVRAFRQGISNATGGLGLPGTTLTWTLRNQDPNVLPPSPSYPVITMDNQAVLTAVPAILFLSQSPAIQRGGSTYGFPLLETPRWDGILPLSPAQIASYQSLMWTMSNMEMPCLYTRYIDIFSSTLTRWTKLATASTASGAGSLLYRYFFIPFQSYQEVPPAQIIVASIPPGIEADSPLLYQRAVDQQFVTTEDPPMWTFNPDEVLATIDLQFRDEYNQALVVNEEYVALQANPSVPAPTDLRRDTIKKSGGFDWLVVLAAEL